MAIPQTDDHKFWLLFEYAAVGVAIVLPDGRFLRANPELCRLLGYREDDLKELDFQALTQREDMERELKLISKARKGHNLSYNIEKRYIRRDGTVLYAHVSVALERDRVGNPIHYIHVVQDITAQQQVKVTQSHLEALTGSLEEAVMEFAVSGA